MALSQSEAKERVEKRAKYENFKMVVCRNGFVNVCNQSHNDDSAHTYSVEVRDGEVRSCSCPHYVHRRSTCKHMTAVGGRPIVVASANAASSTYEGDDTDDESLPEITHHREPEDVGGERYTRCEGCGSESIFGSKRILHDTECPHYGRKEATRSERADFGGGDGGIDEL